MFLIPDFLVWFSMFNLSFWGVFCSRQHILIDPLYFTLFIPQGIMYLLFDVLNTPIDIRAQFVRFSLFIVPSLFSIILTVAYWRKLRSE